MYIFMSIAHSTEDDERNDFYELHSIIIDMSSHRLTVQNSYGPHQLHGVFEYGVWVCEHESLGSGGEPTPVITKYAHFHHSGGWTLIMQIPN